jgi:GNAT superfamily N-acetyltransferase
MEVNIRPAVSADITACGQIAHAAFKDINERHGFENLELPTAKEACQHAEFIIHNPYYYNLVAEASDHVIGLCFLDEHNSIRGIELVCVDPAAQGEGVGRKLMETALERCQGARGVRLLQHTFNMSSLALYASLGFAVKEPLMLMRGRLSGQPSKDVEIRPIRSQELDECGELYEKIHGFERNNEIRDYLKYFTPVIAMRSSHIVAYASAPATSLMNHVVAETENDMKALLLGISASTTDPLLLLLPVRQASLFRWCLEQKLRIVKPFTLMALGDYQEPAGCYLPSALF